MRSGQKGQSGPWQLYDLAKDPGETTDLAKEKPDLLKELSDKWEMLNAEMVDPLF